MSSFEEAARELDRLASLSLSVLETDCSREAEAYQIAAKALRHRAALASEPEPQPVAEGWVLVPKEPTPEMIGAGLIENSDDPDHEASSVGHQWVRQAIYEAMIAASPHLAEEKKP